MPRKEEQQHPDLGVRQQVVPNWDLLLTVPTILLRLHLIVEVHQDRLLQIDCSFFLLLLQLILL